MKLDKETLVKQRFWVLLGVFVPLVLIVLLVLSAGVSGMIATERTAYETSKKNLDNLRDAKNGKFVELLDKKKKTLSDQKDVVWKDAWQTQDGMMSWPAFATAGMQQQLARAYYGKGPEGQEEIPDRDRRYYGDTAYRTYVPEVYRELTAQLSPVEFKDGWEKLFRYVKDGEELGKWAVTPPTNEECWLAQEDIWVQREMALVIKAALDSLAKFKPVGPPGKAEGAVAQYRLRNTNWELNLLIERNEARQLVVSPKSTLKNINPAKRTLLLGRGKQPGVKLRLKQAGVGADVVIEGEPVAWDKTAEFKKTTRIDNLDPGQPLEVAQVFDWYTSPIKRIDDIELSYRSHRIYNLPLTYRQIGKKIEAETPDPAAAPGGAGGGIAPPMMGSSQGGGKFGRMMGGGQGADKPANSTPNGLDRDRYIEVTGQVRRMPVAIVAVLDQAYVEDVLTAFANSRLRIQTTQSHWQHVHDIKPSAPDESTDQPGGSSDHMPPGGIPGSGKMPGPMMGSGAGPKPGMVGPSAGAGGKGGGMKTPPAEQISKGSSAPPFGSGLSRGPGGVMPANPSAGPGGATRMGPMPPGAPKGVGGDRTRGDYSSTDFSEADEDDPNLVELVVYGIASLYERFPPAKPDAGATAEAPK